PINSGRDDAGRASPKLSAIFGPWAKTELFVNFGLGFHSNDARGVTTTVDPESGEPVAKVTPLVQTRGGELGARTEILPDVQSSLALWRLDIDSELLFTGDAGTTEPSRAIDLLRHLQCAGEPAGHAMGEAHPRPLQPVRCAGRRHRLLLHVAPARQACRGRHSFSPCGETQPAAGCHVHILERGRRCRAI